MHIVDCPLCELRFRRESELVEHLRGDHTSARSQTLADTIERTARQRRLERRRRARGAPAPRTRGTAATDVDGDTG
jgi:hypothetical protein